MQQAAIQLKEIEVLINGSRIIWIPSTFTPKEYLV